MLDTGTVCVGNFRGDPARTVPVAGRDGRSIYRDESGAGSVVRLCAIDIRLHDALATRLSALDRILNVGNCGFFEMKLVLLSEHRVWRNDRQNATDEK